MLLISLRIVFRKSPFARLPDASLPQSWSDLWILPLWDTGTQLSTLTAKNYNPFLPPSWSRTNMVAYLWWLETTALSRWRWRRVPLPAILSIWTIILIHPNWKKFLLLFPGWEPDQALKTCWRWFAFFGSDCCSLMKVLIMIQSLLIIPATPVLNTFTNISEFLSRLILALVTFNYFTAQYPTGKTSQKFWINQLTFFRFCPTIRRPYGYALR